MYHVVIIFQVYIYSPSQRYIFGAESIPRMHNGGYRTLYLSGGSALGAWQAGLLSKLMLCKDKNYGHIVAASAGALNATCIALTLYEYAEKTKNDCTDSKLKLMAAKQKVSENLKRLWAENFFIPDYTEHMLRLVFCSCRSGTLFAHEISREMSAFHKMFLPGTVEDGLKNLGREHHGIYIPTLSIVTKLEDVVPNDKLESKRSFYRFNLDPQTYSHAMFTVRCGQMSIKYLPMMVQPDTDWIDSPNESNLDVNEGTFLKVLLSSCSIPVIFPPVEMSFEGSTVHMSDGAVRLYLPHALSEDLENFAALSDFVISSQIWKNESNVCQTMVRNNYGIYDQIMNYQRESYEHAAMNMIYILLSRIKQKSSGNKHESLQMTDKALKTCMGRLRGNVYYIPYIDPINPQNCSTNWKDRNYTSKNKAFLFSAGQKTFQLSTNPNPCRPVQLVI